MTDSNATELLPCPFCGGEAELTGFDALEYWVWCPKCKASADMHTGMENAIAAWNARADYHGYEQAAIEAWESIKAWNARAERGTLTAEQVREAIACNSWQETSMLFEFNASSWQAIADELNARADTEYGWSVPATDENMARFGWVRERTCRIEHVKGGVMYDVWRCSTCGYEYAETVSDGSVVQNYCPNCGARAVGE